MNSLSLNEWLDELGSRTPVPGGGSVAGLNAALAAATLKMVCEYSTGPKFASISSDVARHIENLDKLTEIGKQEVGNDEIAYAALRRAYALPKDSEQQKNERQELIQSSLEDAVKPALNVISAVTKIAEIIYDIVETANKNLISDIAVSASSAKSALEAAIVNIEINAIQIKDKGLTADLSTKVVQAEGLIKKLDSIIESVRKNIKEKAG